MDEGNVTARLMRGEIGKVTFPMQRVFVVDKNKQALMPCDRARARELLSKFRYRPFTIIMLDREGGQTQPIQVKIDPGSKITGIALIAHFARGKCLIWAAELHHRGQQIRRGRRSRKTRYRQPRFLNRARAKGRLPPSKAKQKRINFGFQTGDLVRADVPMGVHVGRVAVRARKAFGLNGYDINPDHMRLLHRGDGYTYAFAGQLPVPAYLAGEAR
jgi:hypothetical protein